MATLKTLRRFSSLKNGIPEQPVPPRVGRGRIHGDVTELTPTACSGEFRTNRPGGAPRCTGAAQQPRAPESVCDNSPRRGALKPIAHVDARVAREILWQRRARQVLDHELLV